jgi:cyclic dehypoxanthinyl futalosine synthase
MDWNRATALEALAGADLLEIGASANQLRSRLHPSDVVTYELRGRAASLHDALAEAVSRRAADISLLHLPDVQHLHVDALQGLLVASHTKLPGVTFQHLPVFALAAGISSLPERLVDSLPALQDAGLGSLYLDFEASRSAGYSLRDLAALLARAAAAGLAVSAAITIGNAESLEQRVSTLALLRDLQQQTGAIQSVLVRVHHGVGPDARPEEEATAVDYLKTLALTRLFLENIEHVQTDWSVMGPKVLELALRFGADDAGCIPWSQAGTPGPSHHGGESELRRIIRDAGFHPVERDALFRQSLLH